MKHAHQKVEYSFLKILTGSDLSARKLPLMEIKSNKPGPCIWLTACAHGDEIGGIVVIQEIFKRLLKNSLLRGSVHAFPLVNPIGFETTARHLKGYTTLSAYAEEDINSVFPGDKNGSVAERIADKVFSAITKTKPTLVIDLHNDWRQMMLYTAIDPNPGLKHKETYERVKFFAKKIGFLVIQELEEEEDIYYQKTLTYSLITRNIPALTLELGESEIVNEVNVEYGVRAIWNVLTYLGMTEPLEEGIYYNIPAALKDKILRYNGQAITSTGGIIRFQARPGEIVSRGQVVARIYNAFGKVQEEIKAPHNAIVLGHSDTSVAFPGVSIMAFGVIPPS